MTTLVKELRDALIEAGATVERADAAAQAVIDRSDRDQFVTKGDLYQALLLQTGITVGLIVTLVKIL